MPKKKSSRPAASLGSYQDSEPKSSSQIRRERIVKTGAVVIVLALLLSLIAGAVSFSPAQAAVSSNFIKSVQIQQVTSETVDTDGDGIENNQDSDVDGDGLVNGEDNDIDGDGIENFEDADPIDTTDIDSKAPEKPDRPTTPGDFLTQGSSWIWVGIPLAVAALVSAWILGKRRKNQP